MQGKLDHEGALTSGGFWRKMSQGSAPWPGGSVGWSVVPDTEKTAVSLPYQGTYPGCGFDPQSDRVWEATDGSLSHVDVSLSIPSLSKNQ